MTASDEAMGPVQILDEDWVEESELEEGEDAETFIEEYEILSSPNDWNVLTLVNFMESGAIKVPAFQRNYVWDIKKASRLIESLLLGLPVPQIFLYERARNQFLIIDGQQRLLTTYFFLKGRIPRSTARGAVGGMIKDDGLDPSVLDDDSLFQDFKLNLPSPKNKPDNRFHRLKYTQLDTYKSSLDLRTLRNVVVKQVAPKGHMAIYEIFNRLNTGGVNLTPQEIRASLFHSSFMTEMSILNGNPRWRELLGKPTPDARMNDLEILIRAAAMSKNFDEYASPMTNFINEYCITAQSFSQREVDEIVKNLIRVIDRCLKVGAAEFRRGNKFSPSLFEAVAVMIWSLDLSPTSAQVLRLASDEEFVLSLQEGSTKTVNVERRLRAARRVLGG